MTEEQPVNWEKVARRLAQEVGNVNCPAWCSCSVTDKDMTCEETILTCVRMVIVHE